MTSPPSGSIPMPPARLFVAGDSLVGTFVFNWASGLREYHWILAKSSICLLACSVCFMSGLTTSVAGDEIVLRSGGVLSGTAELIEVDGEKVYAIVTDEGVSLTLPQRAVRKVTAPSPKLIELERLREEAPDTIEAHEKLANYCVENRLPADERKYHLWQILRHDPDHPEARKGLQFTQHDGVWTTREQLRKFRGYVRASDGWRLPEEIEIAAQRKQAEEQAVEWKKRIKYWTDWLDREQRRQEAINNFLLIRDPIALAPLFEAYKAEGTTVALRELLLQTMVQVDSPALVSILSQIVLYDVEENLREIALTHLAERKNEFTQRFFMARLDPATNNPAIINRAGRAIEVLGSELAVRSLIEAVVTEHKRVEGKASPGNSQSMSFGSGGPNGGLGSFQMGGDGPKVVVDRSNNPGVLAALDSLTQANFGYNKERWLQWYIENESITEIDLRRGEIK